MDPAVTQVSTTCLNTVLKDEPWRTFGFPRRPRNRAWIQRFRAGWRVELEREVLQQMLSVVTAAYVVAGKIPRGSIGLCATAYTSNADFAIAFGFSSQAEGSARMNKAIEKYVSSPPEQWPHILRANIRPELSRDKKFASRLSFGCVKFGTLVKNIIGVLNSLPS